MSDPSQPETGLTDARLLRKFSEIDAKFASLRHELEGFKDDVRETVNEITRRRRYKVAADKGPGTADQTLSEILQVLDRNNHTMQIKFLRMHRSINRNLMREAIELGEARGLLMRGVISRPGKGQPPQIVTTLVGDAPRPANVPEEQGGGRVIWSGDPTPEPRPKRKSPAPPVKGKTYAKCRHFPDGLGPCPPDCEAIFGSVIPPPTVDPREADQSIVDLCECDHIRGRHGPFDTSCLECGCRSFSLDPGSA